MVDVHNIFPSLLLWLLSCCIRSHFRREILKKATPWRYICWYCSPSSTICVCMKEWMWSKIKIFYCWCEKSVLSELSAVEKKSESASINNKYILEIYGKIQQNEGYTVLVYCVGVPGWCCLAGKCNRKRLTHCLFYLNNNNNFRPGVAEKV